MRVCAALVVFFACSSVIAQQWIATGPVGGGREPAIIKYQIDGQPHEVLAEELITYEGHFGSRRNEIIPVGGRVVVRDGFGQTSPHPDGEIRLSVEIWNPTSPLDSGFLSMITHIEQLGDDRFDPLFFGRPDEIRFQPLDIVDLEWMGRTPDPDDAPEAMLVTVTLDGPIAAGDEMPEILFEDQPEQTHTFHYLGVFPASNQIQLVPEPSTYALAALLGILALTRRRRHCPP